MFFRGKITELRSIVAQINALKKQAIHLKGSELAAVNSQIEQLKTRLQA